MSDKVVSKLYNIEHIPEEEIEQDVESCFVKMTNLILPIFKEYLKSLDDSKEDFIEEKKQELIKLRIENKKLSNNLLTLDAKKRYFFEEYDILTGYINDIKNNDIFYAKSHLENIIDQVYRLEDKYLLNAEKKLTISEFVDENGKVHTTQKYDMQEKYKILKQIMANGQHNVVTMSEQKAENFLKSCRNKIENLLILEDEINRKIIKNNAQIEEISNKIENAEAAVLSAKKLEAMQNPYSPIKLAMFNLLRPILEVYYYSRENTALQRKVLNGLSDARTKAIKFNSFDRQLISPTTVFYLMTDIAKDKIQINNKTEEKGM